MKQAIFVLMLAFVCTGSAWADHVGVSVSIGQPNFFGEIDLSGIAPPPVIRENPIIIKRPSHGALLAPIYLRVPPSHAKNWRKYCGRYNACNRPVYFVKDDWYTHEYAPHYRDHHDDHHNDRNDHGH